ncbi:MAG TPA: Cof-type HAD-IIB family hydrolase [Haloplasmataceae bacterium]
MKQKIVFIDIDGTLFDNEHNLIHPSTIKALAKLKEKNIKVCIASGRSMVLCQEVLNRYKLSCDGYVLINGQYVILNEEVIYKNPLPKTFINEFISECKRKQLDYGFMALDDTFVSSHRKEVVKSFSDFKMSLPRVIVQEDLSKELYQALFFDIDSIPYFSQKFAQYVKFIIWSINDGADVIPLYASKKIGMKKIIEKLQINREDVYAFGDSLNDMEMLEYANIGVAMGNAHPELKRIANLVTDDIDKDGLYKALKLLDLI